MWPLGVGALVSLNCQVRGPQTWVVRNSESKLYLSLKLQVPGFLFLLKPVSAVHTEKRNLLVLGGLLCLPSKVSIILCHLLLTAPQATSAHSCRRRKQLGPGGGGRTGNLALGNAHFGVTHAYYFPHLMQPNAQNLVGQVPGEQGMSKSGGVRDIRAPPPGEWVWVCMDELAGWMFRLALGSSAPRQGPVRGTGLAYLSFALCAYFKSVTQILQPETMNSCPS